jgi:hypothetical protein
MASKRDIVDKPPGFVKAVFTPPMSQTSSPAGRDEIIIFFSRIAYHVALP